MADTQTDYFTGRAVAPSLPKVSPVGRFASPVASFRPDPVQLAFSQPNSGISAVLPTEGTRLRGVAGGEAAGLVPFKTRSIDIKIKQDSPMVGGHVDISFSKEKQAKNRVDRLKMNVWASGHLHGIAKRGFRPLQAWFVTLTYAKAGAWRPNHIQKAFDGFRRWCKRRGHTCKYTWVAEIQPKRAERTGDNVVHYHALVWLPVGVSMPFWDKPTRSGSREVVPFWAHGMSNTEEAKSGVGYLMKYLSKLGELTVFPDNLRLYGMGGLDPLARQVRSWYNLPQWAKCLYGVGDLRRLGSSLVVVETGEVLNPMYSCQLVPGGLRLTLLRPLPIQFHFGAYSTFPRSA